MYAPPKKREKRRETVERALEARDGFDYYEVTDEAFPQDLNAIEKKYSQVRIICFSRIEKTNSIRNCRV